MTTIIAIVACGAALWAYVLSATGQRSPSVRRLEEAVIKQQEQLLHLKLYLHWVEENALELASELHNLEDMLVDDYPELIEPPHQDYPTAYDKWGEFDV